MLASLQEQQVGHLPRAVVLHIAPLLDNGKIFLEGIIPSGSKNKYKLPVKLFVYAQSAEVAAVRRAVANAGLSLHMDSSAERMLDVRFWPPRTLPAYMIVCT